MSRKRSGMPFAGRMRNHDDGDSCGERGMDKSILLPDCKSVLQLLDSYDARSGRVHAQISSAKKRDSAQNVERI